MHVIALQLLARDSPIMATAISGTGNVIAGWISIALIIDCFGALVWSWGAGLA